MNIKKTLSAILAVVCLFNFFSLNANAEESECQNPYHYVVYASSEDGKIMLHRDGCIEVNFVAGAAGDDTFYRFRTIGFTITRGLCDENGYGYVRDYTDKNGNTESVGFSFDAANAKKTSKTIDGMVYTTIRFSLLDILEKVEKVSVSWGYELRQWAGFKDGWDVCFRYDSIITMIYDDGDERIQYGYVIDDGTSQYPTTIGITYWNVPGVKCQQCDKRAMFAYCLVDGYWPFFDSKIWMKNFGSDEKICYMHYDTSLDVANIPDELKSLIICYNE